MKNSAKLMLLGAVGCFSIVATDASAQQYAGPLLPHVGGQVTTAFANRYGPDAEGYVTFSAITPEQIILNYSSTRGLNVRRNVRKADRQNSGTYVLGYSANMPSVIPGTTSLGISGASLVELRTKGKTSLSLIYDAKLSHIDGQLTLMEKGIKIPLLVEDQVVQVPALHASIQRGLEKPNQKAITRHLKDVLSTDASSWYAPTADHQSMRGCPTPTLNFACSRIDPAAAVD